MKVNYKNLFYIFHLDGKFTEKELKEVLDAAYEEGRKKGYNDGFEAGKNSHFTITYPNYDWWKQPYYEITCNNKTSDAISVNGPNITPMSITTVSNPPSTITSTTTNNICREFKYNGSER